MGSDQSAYELFDRTLLRVPDYQRGYAWERRHLEEFWEDIEVLPIEARHYTGTVVLLRRPELRVRDDRRVHYDVADIVDGQQRLTTLVLALNEVRRHLEQVGADRPAAQIAEHYLWVQRDGRRQAILQLGADIDGFWQRQVLADDGNFESPSVHSERRLLQARAFFEDRVTRLVSEAQDDATARLLELNDKLTEQLRFTRYEVDDASQVGVIFETLNDRGKPLTELEKAKNYLVWWCPTAWCTGIRPTSAGSEVGRRRCRWMMVSRAMSCRSTLDALDTYTVVQDDLTHTVPNPAKAASAQRIKQLEQTITEAEAALGRHRKTRRLKASATNSTPNSTRCQTPPFLGMLASRFARKRWCRRGRQARSAEEPGSHSLLLSPGSCSLFPQMDRRVLSPAR